MKYLTPLVLIVIFFTSVPIAVNGESEAERKARIEKELQVVEREILKQQRLVEDKQAERQSLERDLDIIDAQIGKAQLGIQARNIAISNLSDQIGEKETVVEILDERTDKQKESIGELIRKIQEVEEFSLVELMLSNKNFSEFFTDFEHFRTISDSLNNSLGALAEIKSQTINEKLSLEEKQQTEAELKELQEREKQTIEAREAEKEKILNVTKGEEAAYQELLETQKKTAAQLRAQLFELLGGGGPIPFPEAVQLAQVAASETGVSASLILAILEQESSYGSNIGSCTYDETVYGKAVMHPDRDAPVFVAMAEVLGFNPSSQQVSCPWIRSGERIGWGGAMGPSQFIPSTWAVYGGIVSTGSGWTYNQSSDVIRRLTGRNTPSSPFNNQDAFMATALLMRDNGAVSGNYNAEWTAAIRYFSGWAGANNPINHPYGDNVMARKARLDGEIATLSGS